MRVRVVLFIISILSFTTVFSKEYTVVDSSFSNNDFSYLENISNRYSVNYSNGLGSYNNIKKITKFSFQNRFYYNFPFVGGYDANIFSMNISSIEQNVYGDVFFFHDEVLLEPKLELMFRESDIKSYFMKMVFSRYVTPYSSISINANGAVNHGGENTFDYVFFDSHEDNKAVKFYSSSNKYLNINSDVMIIDPFHNQLNFYYDVNYSQRDNFSWLHKDIDTVRTVYNNYKKELYIDPKIQDSIYFTNLYNNYSALQDSVFAYDNIGLNYQINNNKYKILYSYSENNRSNEIGFFHRFRRSALNFNSSIENIKYEISYIFMYNYLKSLDENSKNYHKDHDLGFLFGSQIFNNYVTLNQNFHLDENDRFLLNYNFGVNRIINEFFDVNINFTHINQDRDFIKIDSLSLRIPVKENSQLATPTENKLSFNSKCKDYIDLTLSASILDDDILTKQTDTNYTFYNYEENIYKLGLNLDVLYPTFYDVTLIANLNIQNKYYVSNGNIYTLLLDCQLGEYPINMNFRIKKRFNWLAGKLLGNISAEANIKENYQMINLNSLNSFYSIDNPQYSIENRKIIYNLYTNLMFTKFVLYMNVKNVLNKKVYNDYGFRVNPLKMEWGFNWRLYN